MKSIQQSGILAVELSLGTNKHAKPSNQEYRQIQHKESQPKRSPTKRSTRKVRFETVVQILRGSIFWIRQLNTRLRGSSTKKGCWRPRRIPPVASAQLGGAWLAAARFQSDWLCATEFQKRSGVRKLQANSEWNSLYTTTILMNVVVCMHNWNPFVFYGPIWLGLLPRCQRNGEAGENAWRL